MRHQGQRGEPTHQTSGTKRRAYTSHIRDKEESLHIRHQGQRGEPTHQTSGTKRRAYTSDIRDKEESLHITHQGQRGEPTHQGQRGEPTHVFIKTYKRPLPLSYIIFMQHCNRNHSASVKGRHRKNLNKLVQKQKQLGNSLSTNRVST